MQDIMTTKSTHSTEFEIDLTVEDLLDKLIQGQITPKEEAKYNQLLVQRSRMMKPSFPLRQRKRIAA